MVNLGICGGISCNKDLDWQLVLDHTEGINGESWDTRVLSTYKTNTSNKVFFSLPFIQDELMEEINDQEIVVF